MIAHERHSDINKALIDNFIGLQKVMVNLSNKFDNLSTQMSKLLEIFEISARSLAKKDIESKTGSDDTQKILEKLENLSEQAGLIGKGLVLIHEMGSEKEKGFENEGYEKGVRHKEENKGMMSPDPMSQMKPRSMNLPPMKNPMVTNNNMKSPPQKTLNPANMNQTGNESSSKTREIQ